MGGTRCGWGPGWCSHTWSIEDLKGISPSICMHKILMEENTRTSIEHQRRLNLVMKEVVRKEVLK